MPKTNFMIRREANVVAAKIPNTMRADIRKAQAAASGGRHAEAAVLYLKVGQMMLDTDDSKRAQFKYADAYRQASLAENRPLMLRAVNGQGESYREQGRMTGERKMFERAIEFFKRGLEYASDELERGSQYCEMGTTLLLQAELDDVRAETSLLKQAEKNFKKGYVILQHLGGPKAAERQVHAILNLAIVYRHLGLSTDAITHLNIALQKSKYEKLSDIQKKVLENQGMLSRDEGNFEQALGTFQKVLKLHRKDGNRDDEARTLCDLAVTFMLKGDYNQAMHSYEQSKSTWMALGNQSEVDKVVDDIKSLESARRMHHDVERLSAEATSAKTEGLQEEELKHLLKLYGTFKDFADAANDERLLTQVVAALERIVVLRPLHPSAVDAECDMEDVCHDLGNAYTKLKRHADAVKAHLRELNYADTLSMKARALGALAEAKTAANEPASDVIELWQQQISYASRANDVAMEHRAIRMLQGYHHLCGASELADELDARAKELAKALSKMEQGAASDEEEASSDEETEAKEPLARGRGDSDGEESSSQENRPPRQGSSPEQSSSEPLALDKARKRERKQPGQVVDVSSDSEDELISVPRKLKRKSSGPQAEYDHTSTSPTTASCNSTVQASENEALGQTAGKAKVQAVTRVKVCVRGSQDSILVPCDGEDRTVDWLISEASKRLAELLDSPVSIRYLATEDGAALSKKDAIRAVLKDLDVVVAVCRE
ncbi:hypothetical protein DFJ74DRAFT_694558 [Hyaloraphidium curvatum]|nr:hypothetical protein DFJ74DRAFT_694558 [Hyaloraphidium curvatum]